MNVKSLQRSNTETTRCDSRHHQLDYDYDYDNACV